LAAVYIHGQNYCKR